MFDQDAERYATFGLVAKLPSSVIDQIWQIIDEDLKGVVTLSQVLQFALIERHGTVTVVFDDQHDSILEFDLPDDYQRAFPETIAVLDDGHYQTMMLLAELSA
ncbi:hypothetical protein C5Z26_02350 [Lactobacillus sp. CBA3606]|uniref:DUF960 domain-containing protein n=1 Tax=unclassified Lactobacillus TaxID=2620435 RepID=UPI000CFDEE3E|nr:MULTISPECIES: DUF960 domain-containing protein [unclassified Lactobacillus]AVK60385.1 hypothetical protein C5Z25_00705 [Lactobacillus sp. CBA3605]AVK63034.1 hypothetical protein C5Z26_02350 [Lactobacillus sp. CBA3606]